MQGGVAKDALARENLTALRAGLANLERHIENLGKFGVPALVAINRFDADTQAELGLIQSAVAGRLGVKARAGRRSRKGSRTRHRGLPTAGLRISARFIWTR